MNIGNQNTDPQSIENRAEAQRKAEEIRIERAGRTYRHFKGGLYVLDTIAVDSEDSTLKVVYHSKMEPSKVWVRPIEMLDSKVDKVKYPNASQELRFEMVE